MLPRTCSAVRVHCLTRTATARAWTPASRHTPRGAHAHAHARVRACVCARGRTRVRVCACAVRGQRARRSSTRARARSRGCFLERALSVAGHRDSSRRGSVCCTPLARSRPRLSAPAEPPCAGPGRQLSDAGGGRRSETATRKRVPAHQQHDPPRSTPGLYTTESAKMHSQEHVLTLQRPAPARPHAVQVRAPCSVVQFPSARQQ